MSNCASCVSWRRRVELKALKHDKLRVERECFRQAKEIYDFLDKHKTKET